jgi:hypothetical protein
MADGTAGERSAAAIACVSAMSLSDSSARTLVSY